MNKVNDSLIRIDLFDTSNGTSVNWFCFNLCLLVSVVQATQICPPSVAKCQEKNQ